jgi:hypothetical protein
LETYNYKPERERCEDGAALMWILGLLGVRVEAERNLSNVLSWQASESWELFQFYYQKSNLGPNVHVNGVSVANTLKKRKTRSLFSCLRDSVVPYIGTQ